MLFPFKILLKIASALVGVVVLYFAVTAYQVWHTGNQQSSATADAMIVYGSAQYDGTPSPDLRARLDHALSLFEAKRAPVIAVTGGKQKGDRFTEAQVSATYLAARGVPRAVIIEGGGDDSYQNMQSVAPPLKARGVATLLVVTDPFHEDRAMAIASTFGFTPLCAPATNSPLTGGRAATYYLRETVAVGLGRIFGYGLLSNLAH
jgi:uncharacterized SAM-binding protein YcdF (DUF218 family)